MHNKQNPYLPDGCNTIEDDMNDQLTQRLLNAKLGIPGPEDKHEYVQPWPLGFKANMVLNDDTHDNVLNQIVNFEIPKEHEDYLQLQRLQRQARGIVKYRKEYKPRRNRSTI